MSKIKGKEGRPRLRVFHSNKHIYAQIIDDFNNKAITGVSSLSKEIKEKKEQSKSALAEAIGILIAKKAKKKKISQIIFDRGKFKYHGNVKKVAESAKNEGLKF